MKLKIFIMLFIIGYNAMAQEETAKGKTRIFTFSPISKKVSNVNGLVFGMGHTFKDDEASVVINGINLEANPVTALIFLAPNLPEPDNNASVVVNGLHLSTGGFLGEGSINGIGVSVFNVGVELNGLSITGLFNSSTQLNGIHIAGLSLGAEKGSGILIAPFTDSGNFTGLQIGAINEGETVKGLQIGLLNKVKETKGLQIGLWNINEKRSLPFINW